LEWQDALAQEGLKCFHMVDFEAWAPPFDFKSPEGSRDKVRHKRLLDRLLEIMLTHIEGFAGFAESMPISNDAKRAHGQAMEGCVMAAMKHAANDLWDQYQEPINLVFGKQNHFKHDKILQYQKRCNREEGSGRVESVLMGSPNDLPQLQAADILAYEISKEQRGRDRRYPFRTLVEGAKARDLSISLHWNFANRISDRQALVGKFG
jgi:hypothetical protein